MNRNRTVLFCLLSGVVTSVATAQPERFTTADGRGSDNQIIGFGDGRELLNKGQASNLQVRSHDYSGNNYYGVLRFDVETREPGSVAAATLKLHVNGDKPGAGTITVYGLKDGFAGGPDDSGEAEHSESSFTEGDLNWKPATDPAMLTGDNAPGFNEKGPRLDAFAVFNSPFTNLGTIEVTADTKPGDVLELKSAELARFIEADTNGLLVIYLGSQDAFVQLGTKESSQPAELIVGE